MEKTKYGMDVIGAPNYEVPKTSGLPESYLDLILKIWKNKNFWP
jgi:hypothetical protein